MKTQKFQTSINASPKKVWDVLWQDSTYRQWTEVFFKGSYAESDWKEGSTVKFLSPEKDGLLSRITKLVPEAEMFFTHEGEIKKGVMKEPDENSMLWAGAREIYRLEKSGDKTVLHVEIDTLEKEAEYFAEKLPQAIEKVKQISESETTNSK